MESDDREGIVADYLDRLLPDNWNAMDVYQRRAFLGGGEFETEGITGTVRRERVSSHGDMGGVLRQGTAKPAEDGFL